VEGINGKKEMDTGKRKKNENEDGSEDELGSGRDK
jgi:hypothetical protein